jgi:HK97 family phage prohead protease
MGGWFEMVAPTAFTRTLDENPDVLCLYSHDTSLVLGRTSSGTLTISTDAKGLKFECILPKTTAAADLIVLVERGDVSGCSFGFVCVADVWSEDSTGRYIRTLLDVDLYEITATALPAYDDTSLSLRSAPIEMRSKIKAIEKRNVGCQCTCDTCVDSDGEDCANCTNDDCDDLNCGECRSKPTPAPVVAPVADAAADEEAREWKANIEIRLKLLSLKSK